MSYSLTYQGKITEDDEHHVTSLLREYLAECEAQDKVPLLAEVAIRLGVTDQTISNYRGRRHANMRWFREALDIVWQRQRLALMRCTLDHQKFRGAKFLLATQHDMIEPKVIEDDSALGHAKGIEELRAARRRANKGLRPEKEDDDDDE